MPVLLYANFIDTELQAAISEVDLQMLVPSTASLRMPAVSALEDSAFHLSLWDGVQFPEIVLVTENPGTGTLDIERGADGTTPRAWAAGTRARLTVTAEFLNQLPGLALAKSTEVDLDNGGGASDDFIPTQLAVKTYVDTGLALKANLNSPALTGTPTAPTASSGTNSTQIATTAFVKNQAYAPLASPAFSGTPTAPTATPGTNSTQVATTEYVDTAIAEITGEISSGVQTFSTGDIKFSAKAAPDSGWVALNDGTIGNSASAASNRANADCEALYKLLWNNFDDTACPVTSGRGASADADWAGQKPIRLPLFRGRVVGGVGAGSGLTSRAMGATTGAEAAALTVGQLPAHHHALTQDRTNGDAGDGSRPATTWPSAPNSTVDPLAVLDTEDTGDGDPVSLMQPSVFVFAMMKL